MIGNMIKTKRVYLKMSSKEVANKLGVKQATYLNYENNTIDMPTSKLVKIFDILNIDIDYKLNQ